ncbi:GHKL domain-containing protein [Candidatus Enterococcus clewellii]|uniref:Two-component system, LytTR family, sensor histidine kinase AgrC n=1 Tax=Candidatus Enterococcus clewellii TaxID=1834193 RepID=A0A242K074_9ENTE|nr:hypothetical protein A5888_003881 [Enterococcus sp. 9E7_DIV0242]
MMFRLLWLWIGLPLLVSVFCFKEKKEWQDIASTTAVAVAILCYYPLSSTSLSMLLLMLVYFLSLYYSEKNILSAMLYYLFAFVNVELAGTLTYALPLDRFAGTTSIIYIDGLIILILSVTFSLFGKRALIKLTEKNEYVEPVALILGAATFLYFFRNIYLFEVLSERGNELVADTVTGIIGGIFGLLILVLLLNHRSEKMKRLAEQEKMNDRINLDYTINLEKHYQEMRKFKHDYQNVLTSIEAFITEKEYEKFEEYYYNHLQQSSVHLEQLEVTLSELANMKNLEIKGLLYTKLTLASTVGADAHLEIKEVIQIKHHVLPLVRALGIILDNAIEAIEDIGSGKIDVAFIKEEGDIIILIQNSCLETTPPLFVLEEEGFSTKGENRGLGLSNLNELFQHTPVFVETSIDSGLFIQKLTLSEKEEG